MNTTQQLIEQLELAALHSDLCAEQAELIAGHFRPRFEAALNGPKGQKRYLTADPLNYYGYVIDQEREVRRWKADAVMLRAAASAIRSATIIEGDKG